MIDNQAVCEKEVDMKWESQKLLITLKQLHGKSYVDVRKWIQFENGYRPRHGLMLEKDQWNHVTDEVKAFLADNT